MNKLVDEFGPKLRDVIAARPANTVFSLKELVPDQWDEIKNRIGATASGRMFAEAVEANRFPGVRFEGIRRNGRPNGYTRLE